MVTVGEKWSNGSVEVARGGAMTLLPTKNRKEERRKHIMSEVKKRQSKLGRKSASLGLTPLGRKSASLGLTPGMLDPPTPKSEGTITFGNVILRGTSGEF